MRGKGRGKDGENMRGKGRGKDGENVIEVRKDGEKV